MNIFYLHKSQALCARYHCDKHVVKMVLETAQILSTAHHHYNSLAKDELYKPTHINHPCTKWVIAKPVHYYWTRRLLHCLLEEYYRRYGRTHKTTLLYRQLCYIPHEPGLSVVLDDQMDSFIEPPQCMPDEYKCDDTVTAYRNYYKGEKAYMAKWAKCTPQPEWFNHG